jgi:hypothetical protein
MSHREDFFFDLERAVNMSMKKRSIDIPSDKGIQALNELADRAVMRSRRLGSLQHLKCAVELMASDYRPEEVADYLESIAQTIREY